VVRVKLGPVTMVLPRPGRGWGREGFGAGRAGRGAGRRGFAWHRMDRGGGRINRGQWDHGYFANQGQRGEIHRGQDPRPQVGNLAAPNVINPQMEQAEGNSAPNSPPAVMKNLGNEVVRKIIRVLG
jgi:hypothetical protein